jgi:hypothetical protein
LKINAEILNYKVMANLFVCSRHSLLTSLIILFQYGQGIDVTEELIKNTTDLLKKEEYESMRRVVQIKMSRYLNNK